MLIKYKVCFFLAARTMSENLPGYFKRKIFCDLLQLTVTDESVAYELFVFHIMCQN